MNELKQKRIKRENEIAYRNALESIQDCISDLYENGFNVETVAKMHLFTSVLIDAGAENPNEARAEAEQIAYEIAMKGIK